MYVSEPSFAGISPSLQAMASVAANEQQMSAERARPAAVVSGDGDRLSLAGALDITTLADARKSLKKLSRRGAAGSLNIAKLDTLDTPGALFLCGLRDKGVELTGVRAEHRALLDLIDFVGRTASWTLGALLHPSRLRPASISRHVAETGVQALPIVGLMAFLIAIVIGYQGVAQLRPFGGEDYTINLVAVSVLREMGVLITAILVAGRSGSAFTAEIGVMQTREEVDALRVMGIEPMQVLVVPRVIALIITLPLLAFFADIMGLIGGAAISQFLLDVSLSQYVVRLPQVVDGSDLFVGLFKAPVFAFFIAVIGCMHGLKVSGSAESVGRETTRAVVKAIFVVIALDAFFSILFERIGI